MCLGVEPHTDERKDGKDGKDEGHYCRDGKFGGVVGMEIRLVTLPIEVEVTRIEGKADDVAAKNDGHSGDGGDELEGGELIGRGC